DLGVVPATVLRDDLPAGRGSLQAYVGASEDEEAVTLSSGNAIPADHTPIFALRTEDGRDLVLLHAGTESHRARAVVDLPAQTAALSAVRALPAAPTPICALRTEDGRALVLSHAVPGSLRAIAFFDLLANNADRKPGHVITGSCLPSTAAEDIGTFGIDNGLT